MHERDKLAEAEPHYARLVQQSYRITFQKDNTTEGDAEREFRYILSAFLSAARSVLQYARKEVESDPQKLKWYDDLMAHSRELPYFKDKRNTNIHRHPLKLGAPILSITP